MSVSPFRSRLAASMEAPEEIWQRLQSPLKAGQSVDSPTLNFCLSSRYQSAAALVGGQAKRSMPMLLNLLVMSLLTNCSRQFRQSSEWNLAISYRQAWRAWQTFKWRQRPVLTTRECAIAMRSGFMGCYLEQTNLPKFALQKQDTFRLPSRSIKNIQAKCKSYQARQLLVRHSANSLRGRQIGGFFERICWVCWWVGQQKSGQVFVLKSQVLFFLS